MMDKLGISNLKKILVNPFYCINIDEVLSSEHECLISEEDWVKVNLKLIGEIGAENWLYELLGVLEGGYI
jgi:hypothetical protein